MGQLRLENICKGWDFPVLDRIDLTVESGEFFVIVGPSGVGKTTLLRTVAGLEVPDAGRVIVDEVDITKAPPYRRPVAMTFESYALYPHLSVFENIASPLRARRVETRQIEQRVQRVAELLRIETLLKRRPGEISGGQKQRTALGRTLVAEPKVFLLDEPISHLDAKIRHALRERFHTLEDLRRAATLYVTHDYAEALSLGDRIGVMGHGGLIQIGSARELYEQPNSLFVAEHLGQPPINVWQAELQESDGRLALQFAAGGKLTIPDQHAAKLKRHASRRLTVGLRPQHIEIGHGEAGSASGNNRLPATIDVFEVLGAHGVIVADTGLGKMTMITDAEAHFDAGQVADITPMAAHLLYFDATDGRNIMLES